MNELATAARSLGLTERQLQVARLVPFYSYEEIGWELGIAPSTAKVYATQARERLGLKSKRELARYLRDHGII